jgi:hypothetical protein
MSDHMTNDPQFPEAELARLADGSLSSERQDELRAQLKASPTLTRALAEQERALGLVRLTEQVSAPDSLRARLEGLAAEGGTMGERRQRRPRLRRRFGLPALGGAVAVAAAAAVTLVLVLGNGSSGPGLHQTAHVALASATLPPPSESHSNPSLLDVKVDGISFPNWGGSVGWPATGQRADTVAGRRVVTVFYRAHNGARIGYAIVSGSPVAVSGGRVVTEGTARYTLFNAGNARGITWRRNGHTCVIAGRGVSDRTLVALASDDEGRSVASWTLPPSAHRSATI